MDWVPGSRRETKAPLMRGFRSNGLCRLLKRSDPHGAPTRSTLHRELNLAFDESVKRVVFAQSNIFARMELCSALTNDDGTGRHGFAAVGFDSKHFWLGESRPLRVEPPPFFCAMNDLRLLGGGLRQGLAER